MAAELEPPAPTAATPVIGARPFSLLTDHLEQFYGRMSACHVVFRLPDGNRRNGGLYEVAVHIKMPGGMTVDVDRTPGLDERFSDPQFAVHDAFRRASRRLKDRAKVMRHEVKALHKRADRDLDQPPEKTG